MVAYVELYMDQGADFYNTVNLTDDLTNAYINVYGYSVSSQMRRSYYSANATADLNCTISDYANGQIILSLESANTSSIKPGRYVFDLLTTDPFGATNRLLEGIITVTPGVTR